MPLPTYHYAEAQHPSHLPCWYMGSAFTATDASLSKTQDSNGSRTRTCDLVIMSHLRCRFSIPFCLILLRGGRQ